MGVRCREEALYKLEVADNAQLLTPQIEVEDIQTQEYIPGLVEQLTDGRTYYWQVTASDPALNERVSAGTFSFPLADNFPPSAASALYPLQDEEMANDRVVFDWTDSSDKMVLIPSQFLKAPYSQRRLSTRA